VVSLSGGFSRSFLVHLDVSWLYPFTNVLPGPLSIRRFRSRELFVSRFSSYSVLRLMGFAPRFATLIGLLTRLGRPGPMQVSWGHA
jgi:hypothetical protein